MEHLGFPVYCCAGSFLCFEAVRGCCGSMLPAQWDQTSRVWRSRRVSARWDGSILDKYVFVQVQRAFPRRERSSHEKLAPRIVDVAALVPDISRSLQAHFFWRGRGDLSPG